MKVAAFNMKHLGLKKVSDPFVSKYLIKIMSQYSIVVIQEVRDKYNKAMNRLLKELNKNLGYTYKRACSICLGRGTYKEKYVFFYREDEAKLEKRYQYEDKQPGNKDAFAREPFVLHFKCPNTVAEDLVLIPVHTKPKDAQKELKALYDVVVAVRKKWRIDNIMILGDFNADGRYFFEKKKSSLRISKRPFRWLIDDSVDTTVSKCNDKTYDRIVVYGNKMLDAIVPNSAEAFNFQTEFNLTDEEARRISDHYPVEVELKTKPKPKKKSQTKKKGPQKRGGAKRKPGENSAATTSKKRRYV